MPRSDYMTCRRCGRHRSECGELSHTRLCLDCGVVLAAESVIQQKQHDGPIFQHWRARIAASVGAQLGNGTSTSEAA